MFKSFFASLFFFLVMFVGIYSTAEGGPAKYMGVGSCASSGCHGKVAPHNNTKVQQNEYSRWAKDDQHSKAFEHLTNAQGRAIAKNLKIDHPDKSPRCLVCHTTYVKDTSLHGRLYRIEEGVSCESCHAASENYLKAHSKKSASHQKNVELGLRDLTVPATRAQVCLDCHYGNSSTRVTHELYGAGHPRLSFELDTFSALMPSHWKVDKDYIERKGKPLPVKLWLTGQAERARRMLESILDKEHFWKKTGVLSGPDFAVLNCYGCHHRLKDKRWKQDNSPPTLGQPLYNFSSLRILRQAFAVLNPNLSARLKDNTEKFLPHQDDEAVSHLISSIEEALEWLEENPISEAQQKQIIKKLITQNSSPSTISYEYAEQILMGLSSLYEGLSLHDKKSSTAFDKMYLALEDASSFDVKLFKKTLKELL